MGTSRVQWQELTSALHLLVQQFKIWLSYMEMASLLLLFITSAREADWKLQLECIRGMLPYFFAYDV